jgi:predicted dehydrogenase
MTRCSRRDFLRTSGAFALAGVAPARRTPRYDELRVAVVGLRGRGADHVEGFRRLPGVRVTALVDVDRNVLAAAAKKFADRGDEVATFADLRAALDRKDIDAISIATPNHWHSLQGIWACQAGKDVYVEKPVSHNVWEGAQLVAAARKYQRIVQAGMQCRSSQGIADGIALVRAGNLGRIQLARGLCYKPRPSIGKVTAPQVVPPHVDHELWTGPAPLRPLARKNLHYDWHWVWDTGNGDVGNQGIHQMDLARWALGENGWPLRTFSIGGRVGYDDDGQTPNTQLVVHEYEKAPLLFEVRGLPRDRAAQAGDWGKGIDSYLGARVGVVVHCEGGTLRIPDYTRAIVYDRDGKELQRFEGASDHYANFVAAVKSRSAAYRNEGLNAPVQEGHVSSALCHLGNVSHRTGTAMSRKEIEAAVHSSEPVAEAAARLFTHVQQNGVDLDATPLVLGQPVSLDADGRSSGDEAVQRLVRGSYREGFVVPESV